MCSPTRVVAVKGGEMESDEELLIIETGSPDNAPHQDSPPNDLRQTRAERSGHMTEYCSTVLTSSHVNHEPSTEVNNGEVQIELEADVSEKSFLTLPENKDRHLFISHSSDDSHRVWPIVEALEKRFGLKCVYADRDFQPGMDIMTNVKESMERSLKVLLMLSPNFTQSGWCKYERDYAFVQSIESRKNGIIPVLLEECELPPTLKTVTYIDGTQDFCDVPAKVVQAMTRPDIAETMMTFDSLKKYENGFWVDIVAKRDNLWKYRPAKYGFSLEQHHVTAIREAQIKLPVSVIEEAIALLNKCRAVRHYDFSVSRKKLLCWTVFLILLLGLSIYGVTVSDTGVYEKNNEYTKSELATAITSICVAFVVLIVIPVCLCLIPLVCHRQQMYRDVHKKMWKEVFQRCLEMDAILLFSASREKKPTLSVMRYKISECQDFLAHLALSKSITDKESRAKKYAWNLIVEHLWDVTPVMMSDYEKLPNASYNRHNVRLGKACICQCVEQTIDTPTEHMY